MAGTAPWLYNVKTTLLSTTKSNMPKLWICCYYSKKLILPYSYPYMGYNLFLPSSVKIYSYPLATSWIHINCTHSTFPLQSIQFVSTIILPNMYLYTVWYNKTISLCRIWSLLQEAWGTPSHRRDSECAPCICISRDSAGSGGGRPSYSKCPSSIELISIHFLLVSVHTLY